MPGLDGLRGLAVVAVVLYHKGYDWATGGFLGVSTFFTLSGFLITALLMLEHRSTGRIDLVAFWGRRARRLLPASFLTLAGVVAYGWLGNADIDLEALRGDVAAALLYVANWRAFFEQESYLSLFTAPSPLDHFWSLAIEEQFYVVFPLIAAALLGLSQRRRSSMLRHALALGIGLLILASVVATVLTATDDGSSPVYYSTFTRAGEILFGAALAAFITHRFDTGGQAEKSPTRRALGWGGLVALAVLLLGYSQLSFSTEWLHRGGFFGVAAVSTAVVASVALGQGGINTVLSAAPLTALGKISYGIYLVHWPVLLYLNDERTGLRGWALLALQVAVILAVAVVSFVVVETPIRRRRVISPRLGGWLIPITGLAIFAFAALVVPGVFSGSDLDVARGPLDRATTATSANPEAADTDAEAEGGSDGRTASSTDDVPEVADGSGSVAAPSNDPTPEPVPVSAELAAKRAYPDTDCFRRGEEYSGFDVISDLGTDLPKVMLVGDSVACTLGQGLAPWARDRQSLTVLNNGTLGCGILRFGDLRSRFIDDEPVSPVCDWGQRWQDQVDAFDPDLTVVLSGAWDVHDRRLPTGGDWQAPGDPAFDEFLRSEVETALAALTSGGGRVAWLTSPPIELGRNAPQIEGPWPANDPARVERLNQIIVEVVEAEPNAEVIDLAAYTAARDGGAFDPDFRNDRVHFTEAGAQEVAGWLGPLLEERLVGR